MLRETVHPSRLKTILLKEHHSIKCAHPTTAQRVSVGFSVDSFQCHQQSLLGANFFLNYVILHDVIHMVSPVPKLSLSIPFLFGLERGEQCKAALRAGEEAL